MKNELEQCLTQFVSKALDVANKGIDTAGEQIPLVLQEIIYWEVSYRISVFILGLILLSVSFYCAKRGFLFLKQADASDIDIYWITGFVLMVGSITSLFFGVVSIQEGFTFVKALVAPRLVIIDYLKGIL